MRRGRAHVGAGFERAWSAGAELGVLYGITSGGARKAKIFSGARAEAALATRFLGEVREKTVDFSCAISLFGGILVACPSRRQVWAA